MIQTRFGNKNQNHIPYRLRPRLITPRPVLSLCFCLICMVCNQIHRKGGWVDRWFPLHPPGPSAFVTRTWPAAGPKQGFPRPVVAIVRHTAVATEVLPPACRRWPAPQRRRRCSCGSSQRRRSAPACLYRPSLALPRRPAAGSCRSGFAPRRPTPRPLSRLAATAPAASPRL